ncbi:acyltransferase family protein [Candidatus Methylopumilus turicensis]|uniref:acyltransferase family protein n=1 Tax=Candidatus Methylopumilus turicensis TaxID=1581680 RepID=UPI0005F2CCA3|nr:acyltransferase family protein [Candidatus Methylopumilus turicensis]
MDGNRLVTSRNKTIDVAKGLGIILVVFGHNALANVEIHSLIFSFHIPLFLLLSGIFFNPQQSFTQLILAKSDGLLKPYFLVVGVLGLIKIIASAKLPLLIFSILYGNGSNTWPPLWFLPYLFFLFLFAWFFINLIPSRYTNSSWLISLLILVLFILGYTSLKFSEHQLGTYGLPWSLDLVFIGSAYFLIGHKMSIYLTNFKQSFIWFFVATATFCLTHYFFDETIDLNLRWYGDFLICTVQALSSIYLIFVLSKFLSLSNICNKVLAYIGNGSLFILIFHWPFQQKSFAFFNAHWAEKTSLEINSLLSFTIGIIFPLLIWEVVKRNYHLSNLMLQRKLTARV